MAVKKTTKMFVSVFVLIIIAVALMQVTGDAVIGTTSTVSYNDSTAGTTFTAADGAVTDLTGKEVTNFVAINATGTAVPSTNYTLLADQRSSSSGEITAQINVSDNAATIYGTSWNLSYTFEPVGYVSNSSGRNMVTLILIMMAIGLVIVVAAAFVNTDRFRAMLGIGGFK